MPVSKLKTIVNSYQSNGISNVYKTICEYCRREYPFTMAKLRYYRQQFTSGLPFHPFAIYNVDPEAIEYHIEWRTFKTFQNAGRVRNGDWDRDVEPFESQGKYILLHRYFEGELDAEDLTYDCLRDHGYPDDEATEYVEYGYAEYLDNLYESIRDEGIWLYPPDSIELPTAKYDYVAVDIGRDGELIHDNNGCHRLSIARILGFDQIPVRINAIHREWFKTFDTPSSHPELTYVTEIPIRWKGLYTLDQNSGSVSLISSGEVGN